MRISAVLLLVLASLAVSLHAQEVVRPGEVVSGRLEATDSLDAEGRAVDLFTLDAPAGTRVLVTVESPDFDTWMSLDRAGPDGFTTVRANDDAEGLAAPTDSRLVATLEADDGYRILVRSYEAAAFGAYSLRVEEVAAGAELPVELAYGERATGALEEGDPLLDDGTFYDVYLFRGAAGDRVFVSLEADFDAYLVLGPDVGGTGLEGAAVEDDDGLGGTDAFLAYTLPADGSYRILATSLVPDQGPYALRLWTDAGMGGSGAGMPADAMAIAITPEERSGLELGRQEVRNDALGFSFASPGADFFLADTPEELEEMAPEDSNYWNWTLSDVEEKGAVSIVALKTPGPVTEEIFRNFATWTVDGMGQTGGEDRSREMDWATRTFSGTRSGGRAGEEALLTWRCSASPGTRDPGVIICLLGVSVDGGSFVETFRNLEVR